MTDEAATRDRVENLEATIRDLEESLREEQEENSKLRARLYMVRARIDVLDEQLTHLITRLKNHDEP